jgi:malonyl-CoA O-methyltransferase
MPEKLDAQLDSSAVRRAFDRAAATYDETAVLQREVGERLVARLQFMQIAPSLILDLGAGTGYCARLLEARYRRAQLVLLDPAPAMLARTRKSGKRWFSHTQLLCADAAQIALADRSIDLIFSNLTLHWCGELLPVLRECRRVLRPGGLLLFSTLGPATLQELRAAWASIDEGPHVHIFLDMHDIGDALVNSGLSSPVLDRENLVVTYSEIAGLLRDLKAIGGTNSHHQRKRGLSARATFAALSVAYEPYRQHGKLPATYEIVFGHAWAPLAETRPQDGSTVATFPFKNLSKRVS